VCIQKNILSFYSITFNQFEGFEFAQAYAIAATGAFFGIFHHNALLPVFVAYQFQYIVFTLPHVCHTTFTSGATALNGMDYPVPPLPLAENAANQPKRYYRTSNS
jgi:hypothetical protein